MFLSVAKMSIIFIPTKYIEKKKFIKLTKFREICYFYHKTTLFLLF